MNPFAPIQQNALAFKLTPVSLRELMVLGHTPCDLYLPQELGFKVVLKNKQSLTNEAIKNFLSSGVVQLFAEEEHYPHIIEAIQSELKKITRSLSIGNPLDNAKRQVNLITIHLTHLYETPTDNEKLQLQFQSVKNLAHFLINNPKVHSPLYNSFKEQKHHYIFAQPMLASIFLLGILQQSRLLSHKELESLFLTSYFKDIGMSIIPVEKYNHPELSRQDKALFAKHPQLSLDLLAGRVALSPTYLKIIENHHTFSLLGADGFDPEKPHGKFIGGFETMIISVTDIIAAMISERPYREATSLFDALELIRVLIADNYPEEFKYIVHYFRQFFKEQNK